MWFWRWLDEYIGEEVNVNGKHYCQYLKVVDLGNFAGCQDEVEFVLHLLKYTVLVEKIIIQLMPSFLWGK